MQTLSLPGHAPIDLNQPGSYLTWNVFTISVANLVLIAVMVVIFGVALLLPFPGRRRPALPPEEVTEPFLRLATAADVSGQRFEAQAFAAPAEV